MFISASHLGIQYGVDDKIAKFFVDREPPAANLYWKDKLLYLRPEPGYLFIPLITDILYKLGIARDEVTGSEFVTLMEAIGHISALEESRQIDKEDATKQLTLLATSHAVNDGWLQMVLAYINNKPGSVIANNLTPFKALHRGDAFLFALGAIDFSRDKAEVIIKYWFALISTLLLLDDAEDVSNDAESGDENAFIEMGTMENGIEKMMEMVKANLQTIKAINNTLAQKLDGQIKNLLNKPHIAQLINP